MESNAAAADIELSDDEYRHLTDAAEALEVAGREVDVHGPHSARGVVGRVAPGEDALAEGAVGDDEPVVLAGPRGEGGVRRAAHEAVLGLVREDPGAERLPGRPPTRQACV